MTSYFSTEIKIEIEIVLCFHSYGGPGSQRVSRTFPMGSYINNWLMYLKSTHRIVVASVDGRGSSGRGQDFRYRMYRKLGTVEVWDQMMAAEYVNSSMFLVS